MISPGCEEDFEEMPSHTVHDEVEREFCVSSDSSSGDNSCGSDSDLESSGSDSEYFPSDRDSEYFPTLKRPCVVTRINLPNKLGYIALPQFGKFLDMMNKARVCATPGCDGDIVPVTVKTKGLGGSFLVVCCCNGCAQKGGVFETSPERVEELGNSTVIGMCVQVAFILAGNTFAGYNKLLKNALGIEAVDSNAYMDTICCMYPVVKSFLDEVCEIAKQEMKAKEDHELGSWKRAVTVADGTWHTRGWHSKNATFTIRNYLNGALLYCHHLCQKGGDDVIKEELYKGTSKSAEGYAARITFQKAKLEGMEVVIHWQDADSSTAKVVNEIFPRAEVMICGGHAGRAHKKILELRQKIKTAPKQMVDKYKTSFPKLSELSCKCEGNHTATCGCLTRAFISKAHTKFTSILMEAQSQEEFVRRIQALPKHARDIHEWEGGRCDFHPLRICMCHGCDDKKNIRCVGVPYKASMRLDCEFHAMLYEIECTDRAALASKLVHPILKRGHSNACEASHSVLIRFRSKQIPLQRLHYHLSTNLGLLQANLTYMHARFGTSYHWIPELYRRMNLPLFEGVVEALERYSVCRKKRLEHAKTPAVRKRINELKKMRFVEQQERIKWSKKHGNDTYFGGPHVDSCDDEYEAGVDTHRKKRKPCTCGSFTHQRSNHKDCLLNKNNVCKDPTRDEYRPSEGTRDSEVIDILGESEGGLCGRERAHKRGCRSSCVKPKAGVGLNHDVGSPGSVLSNASESSGSTSSMVEEKLKVGDYVALHTRTLGGDHLPCRIVRKFCARYQLYCSKGVLETTFSHTELTNIANNVPILLDNWRQAPTISLRNATRDPELVEHCVCHIPLCPEGIVVSSDSEEGSEVTDIWVDNGAYCLSHTEHRIVCSQRGWLTDRIISAAQMLLLQFYPSMAGLQPPVLQNAFAFQVHSGEFVQIVHVRNNHWCVVSTVGCDNGVVCVYDSMYKTASKDLVHLIASMVYSNLHDTKIVMMDVEKQSNGSDCGVLSIAYAFDICSDLNPCEVRFDPSRIRQHLATSLQKCQVSRFPTVGERKSVTRKPKTVELHCSCRMPEEEGFQMAMCDSCHVWYHRHCMDIPSDVFSDSEVHWECRRCTHLA